MLVAFPKEFPKEAVHQVVAFVTKQDQDLGRAALAAWNILGFAGHLSFGDVVIPTLNQEMKPLSHEEMIASLTTLDTKGAIPPWVIDLAINIIMRLINKYLPQ
jgi:hypothetical protein